MLDIIKDRKRDVYFIIYTKTLISDKRCDKMTSNEKSNQVVDWVAFDAEHLRPQKEI